jgi:alpha-beta hydrolase superfamily lysophospholipase
MALLTFLFALLVMVVSFQRLMRRTLAALIPEAQLIAVPDGGHLLLGHTDEVRAEVTRFLRNQISEIDKSQRSSPSD